MITSLELSKRLYEKGLRIETENWWIEQTNGWRICSYPPALSSLTRTWNGYPAPSTDELWGVLPDTFSISHVVYYLHITKFVGDREILAVVRYRTWSEDILIEKDNSSPSEALGLMVE